MKKIYVPNNFCWEFFETTASDAAINNPVYLWGVLKYMSRSFNRPEAFNATFARHKEIAGKRNAVRLVKAFNIGGNLRHPTSSELSPQSLWPSHLQPCSIQRWFWQVNSDLLQENPDQSTERLETQLECSLVSTFYTCYIVEVSIQYAWSTNGAEASRRNNADSQTLKLEGVLEERRQCWLNWRKWSHTSVFVDFRSQQFLILNTREREFLSQKCCSRSHVFSSGFRSYFQFLRKKQTPAAPLSFLVVAYSLKIRNFERPPTIDNLPITREWGKTASHSSSKR